MKRPWLKILGVDEDAYVENVAPPAGFRQEECVASSDVKRRSNEEAGK
jgi:hypothetical protein